jgi:hypothetical protein
MGEGQRMADIETVSIDVRDVDHEWFVEIAAFLDRGSDRYYFPRGSVERLGEIDDDTGNAWLIDGRVEAATDEIVIDGRSIPVWSTRCDQLIVRPARARS